MNEFNECYKSTVTVKTEAATLNINQINQIIVQIDALLDNVTVYYCLVVVARYVRILARTLSRE